MMAAESSTSTLTLHIFIQSDEHLELRQKRDLASYFGGVHSSITVSCVEQLNGSEPVQ